MNISRVVNHGDTVTAAIEYKFNSRREKMCGISE